MHRHVVAHRDQVAIGCEDRRRIVPPFLDIWREGSPSQRRAHLRGNRMQRVPHHRNLCRVERRFFIGAPSSLALARQNQIAACHPPAVHPCDRCGRAQFHNHGWPRDAVSRLHPRRSYARHAASRPAKTDAPQSGHVALAQAPSLPPLARLLPLGTTACTRSVTISTGRVGSAYPYRLHEADETAPRRLRPNRHAARIPARDSAHRPSAVSTRPQSLCAQRPLLPRLSSSRNTPRNRAVLPAPPSRCAKTPAAGPHPESQAPTARPAAAGTTTCRIPSARPARTHAAALRPRKPAAQNRADRNLAPPTRAVRRSPCAHSPRAKFPRPLPPRCRIAPRRLPALSRRAPAPHPAASPPPRKCSACNRPRTRFASVTVAPSPRP